jgi:hypothetical protein
MRTVTVAIIAGLLAAPAAAVAKGGIEFDTYPENSSVGKPIHFSVLTYMDPPRRGQSGHAIQGVRPLVVFRSKSGRVVRVRATRTDLNGIAYGSVAFPDKGPWTSELRIRGVTFAGSEPGAGSISVGTGLVQTIPGSERRPPATSPSASDDGGFPWIWVLSLASIGSALLVFVMRRRGHWGAA